MSRWEDQFKQHPIHNTIAHIKEISVNDSDELSENDISEHRRLIKIIDSLHETIEQLDPEVTPFAQLDQLNNVLTQHVLNPIQQYKSNGAIGHLTNANNQLTNHLVHISYLLPVAGRSRPLSPTKKLEQLVDTTTARVTRKANALENEISEISNKARQQEERLSELDSLVENRKQETDARLSEWQQQFSEAQDNRSSEFNSWREKVDDKASTSTKALIEKTGGTLDEHIINFKDAIEKVLVDAEIKHQAILDLYELTAGDSVAAGYLRNARNEGKQANFWRWVSIFFIIATVSWLGCAYVLNPGMNEFGDINWSKILMTFSISGVLLWGSAYAAQQSSKHRNNEKKTRWFALEIKAIDPFISSLSTDQQNELKKQLSERLFAQSSSTDDNTQVIDEHALNVMVGAITKILGKIPQKQ